jgi:hypothetical protein
MQAGRGDTYESKDEELRQTTEFRRHRARHGRALEDKFDQIGKHANTGRQTTDEATQIDKGQTTCESNTKNGVVYMCV